MKKILVSRLRLMTEAEAAWVGAFIEADGSVAQKPNGDWTLNVSQQNVEIMSALFRITHVGSIHLRYPEGSQHLGLTARRDLWTWQVQTQIEVQDIATRCQSYSEKLQKVLCGLRG
jgi:hypothetical protein